MAAVFIPQKVLDGWADQGKIELDGDTLLMVKEKRTVDLNPAVRFRSLLAGDDDPNQLIGKVKTHEQLVELGAEHYMDSVILGDFAYQVEEGFMGDLSGPKKPAAPKAAAAPPPTPAPPAADATQEVRTTPAPISNLPGPAPVTPSVPPPASQDAAPTLVPQAAPPATAATPLEKALSQSADGEASDDDDESEAAALSRLFLDTVQ